MRSLFRFTVSTMVLLAGLLTLTGCPLLFPPTAVVTVIPGTATIAVGGSISLTASSTNRGDDFVWTTSNAAIATVTSGIVSGVSAGVATITATGTTSGKFGTCVVTVESTSEGEGEAVEANTIVTDTNSVNVPEGGTAQFRVKLSARPATDVTVSVANVAGDSSISVQSGASLTFSSALWNVFKAVTLYAAVDADAIYGQATIRCSAPGFVNKNVTATEQDKDTPPVKKALVGWVHDTEGMPVAFAAVTAGSQVGNTDGVGLYRFEQVDEAPDLLVAVQADGFTANSRAIDTTASDSPTANFVLKRRVLASPLNIDTGGTVEDGSGNSLTLAAKSLVTKSGKSVTGDVDVSITALDVTNPSELKAFPGSFNGLALARKTGGTVQLETFALAEYDVRQNGEEVQLSLAKSAGATIRLRLNDDRLAVDENVPLWYFNESTGLWEEVGNGLVQSDLEGLYWEANIPHFSWWNCDKPIDTKQSISGRVLDVTGGPISGAMVFGEGTSYSGTSYGMTDADGQYCMDVKCDSTVNVSVLLPGASQTVDSELVTVSANCGVTCGMEGGTTARDLQGYFPSGIEGYVRNGATGAPLEGITVYSSSGVTAVTDATGYYMMNAPEEAPVTVYVVGRPSIVVMTGLSGDPWVQANFDVELPSDGDVVGQIMSVNLVDQTGLLPDLPAKSFSAQVNVAQFFADLPYGIDRATPGDSYNVYTMAELEGILGSLGYFAGKSLTSIGDLVPTGPLDPGATGSISDGVSENAMVSLSDFMNNLNYWQKSETPDSIVKQLMAKEFGLFDESLLPFMSGTFLDTYSLLDMIWGGGPQPMKQLPQGRISNTAPLAFSWPGGLDIGAFDCTVNPGEPVTFTSLDTNANGLTRFDFSNGLNLTWTVPSTPGDLVVLVGAFISLEAAGELGMGSVGKLLQQPSDEVFVLTCAVEDDGEFNVPLALLKRNIPRWAANKPLIGALGFGRVYRGETSVPLTGGGNGTVNLVRAELSFNVGYVPEVPDVGGDAATAESIPLDGSQVYGMVDDPNDPSDWYKFTATAGHVYSIPVGGGCDITLVSADGTELAVPVIDYMTGDEILWYAPSDGEVYVRTQYSGGGEGLNILPVYFFSLSDMGEMPESVTFPDVALELAIRDAMYWYGEGEVVPTEGEVTPPEGEVIPLGVASNIVEGEWISVPVNQLVAYGNGTSCTGTVTVPGATDVRVHFSTIELGYGDQMSSSSGDWWGEIVYTDVTTNQAYADNLYFMLYSDGSNPGTFVIDAVQYIGAADLVPEFTGDLFTAPCGDIPLSQGPIPIVDLLRLGDLYADYDGITDLSGIEWCKRLHWLELAHNRIADLSPLAGLEQLEHLGIGSNGLTDISGVANLPQLTSLDLDSNEVSDLTPLAGLVNLYRLSAAWNMVTDISPLANLTGLFDLQLGNNQIVDLAPLEGLIELNYVGLESNLIVDVTALVNNLGIGLDEYDWSDSVNLCDNPLSSQALTVDIPAIEARGAMVETCNWSMEGEMPMEGEVIPL